MVRWRCSSRSYTWKVELPMAGNKVFFWPTLDGELRGLPSKAQTRIKCCHCRSEGSLAWYRSAWLAWSKADGQFGVEMWVRSAEAIRRLSAMVAARANSNSKSQSTCPYCEAWLMEDCCQKVIFVARQTSSSRCCSEFADFSARHLECAFAGPVRERFYAALETLWSVGSALSGSARKKVDQQINSGQL